MSLIYHVMTELGNIIYIENLVYFNSQYYLLVVLFLFCGDTL